MSSPTPLPYPEIHPIVDDNNQGPAITIAAALCTIVSTLFFASRLWIRWPWTQLFGRDDVATAVGVVVSIVQSTLVMVAVRNGLGQRVETVRPELAESAEKMLYASCILYVLSLCLGKLAVGLLFIRLSSGKLHLTISKYICAACVAFGIISIFLVGIRQETTHPWDVRAETAESTYNRWLAIEVLSAAIEGCLISFAVFLVWKLQMSTQSKLTVISGFAARLPLFAIAAARLWSIRQSLFPADPTSVDSTFSPTIPTILLQLEMHTNLISATIPCLRIFLRNFNSGYLGNAGVDAPNGYKSRPFGKRSGISGDHSAGSVSNLATQGSGRGGGKAGFMEALELRSADRGETKSKASHTMKEVYDDDDAASDGSKRRIMVRQTVDVMYE
ncbi:hypothetical protein K431DRAFT_289963 [Polychaeton citri CBS 116435]|uniref:Rhodopsin domain-containing protein n=1 Tax=Polychaeton citri CBS 116435 TaxID=1314669 RepID=A0A9P4QJJ7_9PEZI|nr:hypothetical protein K431DRAFT_289963 [Polychaeton citri CBS 116435]